MHTSSPTIYCIFPLKYVFDDKKESHKRLDQTVFDECIPDDHFGQYIENCNIEGCTL